jgi:hypothetical protein
MVRTVISLDREEKRWLDRTARQERVSMSSLIRRAVSQLRRRAEAEAPPVELLIRETRGIWKWGDPLAYQKKMREEWQRHR